MKFLPKWAKLKAFFFHEEKKKPPSNVLTLGAQSSYCFESVAGLAQQNPDEILKKQGRTAYEEMEAKDPHLYSVYQTRKLAVSRIPWVIEPASSSKRDAEIADFVLTVISDCKGPFSEDLFQLMDAVGKGFSVLEIIWKEITSGKYAGKWGIQELIFHPQSFWAFNDRKCSEDHKDHIFFKDSSYDLKEVPWSKVVHYAYDSQDTLYGRAAFKSVFWHWWFKKEAWKWWIQYLEKYASPTALGRYPMGTPSSQIDELLDTLDSIQTDTSVAIPDQMAVELLEASRSGLASYQAMSDAVNAEISKAILGATQTVEEGRRGSYALSRSHSQVRQERVEADGVMLADTIQQQLIERIVDFNYAGVQKYPQFLMKYPVGTVDSREKSKTLELPSYFKHAEEAFPNPKSVLIELSDNGPILSFAQLGKYHIVKKQISDLDIYEVTKPRTSGRYRGVSIGRDENGFFVTTHRCRSRSYKSALDIPDKVIAWIRSTG